MRTETEIREKFRELSEMAVPESPLLAAILGASATLLQWVLGEELQMLESKLRLDLQGLGGTRRRSVENDAR